MNESCRRILAVWLIGVVVSASWETVVAQPRCDSSKIVGPCNASVSIKDGTVQVTSDDMRCSRVTWYADEHPHTTVVTDGRDRSTWLGSKNPQEIRIADCQVLIDRTYPTSLQQSRDAGRVQLPTHAARMSGPRCDSSKVVRACRGTVSVQDGSIEVSSDDMRCSRVIWYADEHPNTTVVTDGRDRSAWLGSKPPRQVRVASCDVLIDRSFPTSLQTSEDGGSTKAPRSGGPGSSADCEWDPLLVQKTQAIANACEKRMTGKSICHTARIMIDCAREIEAASVGCPSGQAQARSVRLDAEAQARAACAE